MNPNDPIAVEAQKKRDIEYFEETVKKISASHPNYVKKEFTFNRLEQTLLAEQDTIIALAQQAKDHLLNRYVLGRVGVPFSDLVEIHYSIGVGRFAVFIPKDLTSPESTGAEKPKQPSQKKK